MATGFDSSSWCHPCETRGTGPGIVWIQGRWSIPMPCATMSTLAYYPPPPLPPYVPPFLAHFEFSHVNHKETQSTPTSSPTRQKIQLSAFHMFVTRSAPKTLYYSWHIDLPLCDTFPAEEVLARQEQRPFHTLVADGAVRGSCFGNFFRRGEHSSFLPTRGTKIIVGESGAYQICGYTLIAGCFRCAAPPHKYSIWHLRLATHQGKISGADTQKPRFTALLDQAPNNTDGGRYTRRVGGAMFLQIVDPSAHWHGIVWHCRKSISGTPHWLVCVC